MKLHTDATGPMAIGDSLRRAWDRTRATLWPGNPRVWLLIGVVAFLDGIGQGSVGFSYALRRDSRQFVSAWLPYITEDADVAALLLEQTGLLLVVGMPGIFLVFLGSIALLWIGSHGQVMFVRAAAHNTYGFRENWRETREAAQSLFMFRLALAAFGFILLVVFVLVSSLFVRGDAIESGASSGAFQPVFIAAALGVSVTVVVNGALRNLVAPIMLQLNVTCFDACKVVWIIVIRHWRGALAFALLHTLWVGLTWAAWVFGGCATCFLGLLPIVHHALWAPLYVFDRLFSMYLLESLWPNEQFVHPVDSANHPTFAGSNNVRLA